MTTTEQVFTGDVQIAGWLCNGSINPLIRSYGQLEEVAQAPEEIDRALSYAAIELEVYFKSPYCNSNEVPNLDDDQRKELFNKWREAKRRPVWMRRAEMVPGVRTTAQLLANHGNLECRAQCCDCADLIAAIKRVPPYNNFESDNVAAAFERFNLTRYYPGPNPNTSNDALTYYFGWENTSVIYIKALFYGRVLCLSQDWKYFTELDRASFRAMCQHLGQQVLADENYCYEEDERTMIWRLWWD